MLYLQCDGVERIAVGFLLRGRGKDLSVVKYRGTQCPGFKPMEYRSDRPYLTRQSLALIDSQWQLKEIIRGRESPRYMMKVYSEKRYRRTENIEEARRLIGEWE